MNAMQEVILAALNTHKGMDNGSYIDQIGLTVTCSFPFGLIYDKKTSLSSDGTFGHLA